MTFECLVGHLELFAVKWSAEQSKQLAIALRNARAQGNGKERQM